MHTKIGIIYMINKFLLNKKKRQIRILRKLSSKIIRPIKQPLNQLGRTIKHYFKHLKDQRIRLKIRTKTDRIVKTVEAK